MGQAGGKGKWPPQYTEYTGVPGATRDRVPDSHNSLAADLDSKGTHRWKISAEIANGVGNNEFSEHRILDVIIGF